MSYGFGMFFKQCKSFEEAVNAANEFTKICREHEKEMFEIYKYMIPSIRGKGAEELTDTYWLYSVFNFQFVYWDEFKLLGLCGDRYPEEAKRVFDTHQYFQNSCDQDYEYESWENVITVFKDTKAEILAMSDEELCEKYSEENKYLAKDEIMEDIEYARKSYLYYKIFSMLKLNSWLYGEYDESFRRITLNSIDSQETLFKINIRLKKYIADLSPEFTF